MNPSSTSALVRTESRLAAAALNYAATLGVILLGYLYYTKGSQYHIGALDARLLIGGVEIRFQKLLLWLVAFFAIALVPYYLLLPEIRSKARIACALAIDCLRNGLRARCGTEEKQALLALGLKAFFIPLMVNWTIGNTAEVLNHFHEVRAAVAQPSATFLAVFNNGLYLMLFKLLLMIDVLWFTVGYMVELPALNNRIRSVDPTASGWLVCIICYPPFNQPIGLFFPWQSADFPTFSEPFVHVAMNCAVLLAMGIYAWASVALGWRASNLTNRGVVASGPYAWVRHPAYAAKNLAWWLGGVPMLAVSFSQSLSAGLWAVLCLGVWTSIYVLRATTEERHLLMGNNGYAEYMRRVRWRFIPRVV